MSSDAPLRPGMTPGYKVLFAAALALLLGGLAVLVSAGPAEDGKQRLGLMTSLPIYWSEVNDLNELIVSDSETESANHWARIALERNYELVLLDSLHEGAAGDISDTLAGLDLLLLAQPRSLVPGDNVALDRWVRQGGSLLMFSDPVLTEGSRFGLGDKRRPQDIGLVPAVFARWGLAQNFADGQPDQGELIASGNIEIPVNQRGTFTVLPDSGGECAVSAQGLIAECRIGEGRALLIGDAAVLDARNVDSGAKDLAPILREAFDR